MQATREAAVGCCCPQDLSPLADRSRDPRTSRGRVSDQSVARAAPKATNRRVASVSPRNRLTNKPRVIEPLLVNAPVEQPNVDAWGYAWLVPECKPVA